MSRRLRIEEEKVKQLKDELQDEEDKMKLMQEKIFGPLVWRRFQNGIKVEDLQENRFNDAVDLIMQYYTAEDVLFRNTKISEDKISQNSFADRLIFKLKDRASIIAIDEENENCVAGVLVLNPVQKCDFGRVYSRTMLVEGKSYKSITDFMNYINRKVDVFEVLQCEIYLRYYLLCIAPEYRGRALGYQMMLAGLDVARHLKIPVVMGVFNNYKTQTIGRKIGINQILYEFSYVKWSDKNGELIFCNPGPGNYTCNIQAGPVPPPPEPGPSPEAQNATPQVKTTRAEKRKNKLKADAKPK
ncbi:uncharacterized protein LOC109538683 isoform X2 [Dendroctonus ponderosae]|uniref:N-acetyltransferase domain-containing protein n=1 Tax=Dendroctonus ponderosae TaxID=77166 RepID=A0AAR5PKP7_DENPD|nr:uncharacterized protein LOC109538683 isoform X2 [Dendroctonus ponderosae]KAH1013446.1 hypothetical protein HUJ04_002430 [Dendroctonus ponderosae]KAH1024657.1 hypothetical protein HUJ05_004111 [Dendroctonus ponderosae]